jgi:tRNA1(Val) A37 N6-methylase TrmN6
MRSSMDQVMLVQPRGGHRAGLDAALLQALVPGDASGEVIDLGAGVGTVGFAVAARAPALSVKCVENDPELVACAESALERPENVDFAARVRVVQADVTDRREVQEAGCVRDGSADFVLMNPPYDQAERVRPSPDAGPPQRAYC